MEMSPAEKISPARKRCGPRGDRHRDGPARPDANWTVPPAAPALPAPAPRRGDTPCAPSSERAPATSAPAGSRGPRPLPAAGERAFHPRFRPPRCTSRPHRGARGRARRGAGRKRWRGAGGQWGPQPPAAGHYRDGLTPSPAAKDDQRSFGCDGSLWCWRSRSAGERPASDKGNMMNGKPVEWDRVRSGPALIGDKIGLVRQNRGQSGGQTAGGEPLRHSLFVFQHENRIMSQAIAERAITKFTDRASHAPAS